MKVAIATCGVPPFEKTCNGHWLQTIRYSLGWPDLALPPGLPGNSGYKAQNTHGAGLGCGSDGL